MAEHAGVLTHVANRVATLTINRPDKRNALDQATRGELIKEAVRASVRTPLDEGLRHETTLCGLAFASQDKAEGVAAFLAKRAPEFTGR